MDDDLISREALKKKFERLVDETIPYDGVAVNDMRELIDNAPTVDFLINMKDLTAEQKQHFFNVWRNASFKITNERPQGEWKVYARQGGIPISDYCTNCKYEMKWYRNKYNYCPNCGADMRKGEEE